MWSKIPALIMLLAMVSLGLVGCAEREHSVRTEMVQTPSTVYYPATARPRTNVTVTEDNPVVVEEETATVQTETHTEIDDDDEPDGILSTTVHFIGEIIALPFRLVAGLFRAIF